MGKSNRVNSHIFHDEQDLLSIQLAGIDRDTPRKKDSSVVSAVTQSIADRAKAI